MNILYLSYTGLLEPLGQSQVLAYLRGLARDHRITLITFERPESLAEPKALEAGRATCEAVGIRWLPQRYHKRPRMAAKVYDMGRFTAVALRETATGKIDLVHARSYLPAFVALAVKLLTRTPFIFDMRAFWPDEMVAAHRLRAGSLLFRLLKWAERVCIKHAAAVVSLTQAGVDYMRPRHDPTGKHVRFVVVPTCVDLDRFRPGSDQEGSLSSVGSVGSVLSGWFRFDWLTTFLRVLSTLEPHVELRIVTREDAELIRGRLSEAGVRSERLVVYGVSAEEVPAALTHLSAAAMFFETGVAKMASCPTRMGEILACGLPVVANSGVGDVGELIHRYRVGVLVEENSERAMQLAIAELIALLRDPELSARCRSAAEDWFSLAKGTAAYEALYQQIASSRCRAPPDDPLSF